MYQYFVDIVNKHPLPPPPNSFYMYFVCLQIKKDICFRIVSMQSMETHKCICMVMYFHVNSRIKIKTPYQTCHQEHSPSR